jgi:hypothetical protein
MMSHKKFAGLLGYEFSANPYLAFNLQGTYRSITDVEDTQAEYGPLSFFRLRLANPFMLVPFVDFGGAYYTWTRKSEALDFAYEGPVQMQRGGLNLHLARHFSVVVQQTVLRFLDQEPVVDNPDELPLLAKKRLEVLFEFAF